MRAVRRGSVIMEYLIVQVFVAGALALTMHSQFFQPEYGQFVGIGRSLKESYQRILAGLSLPIP